MGAAREYGVARGLGSGLSALHGRTARAPRPAARVYRRAAQALGLTLKGHGRRRAINGLAGRDPCPAPRVRPARGHRETF